MVMLEEVKCHEVQRRNGPGCRNDPAPSATLVEPLSNKGVIRYGGPVQMRKVWAYVGHAWKSLWSGDDDRYGGPVQMRKVWAYVGHAWKSLWSGDDENLAASETGRAELRAAVCQLGCRRPAPCRQPPRSFRGPHLRAPVKAFGSSRAQPPRCSGSICLEAAQDLSGWLPRARPRSCSLAPVASSLL
jgi:hypothetical protein